MSLRRGPLITCGISLLEIANGAHRRVQDFNGPIGSATKKISMLASPVVYALQFHLVATLSFLDGRILAVEDTIEFVFPPSKHVFNKIDELVRIAEALPQKLDDAFNKFPIIIHQVPFLDWALVQAILWLNFLISTLAAWGSGCEKEKEIVVDTNCKENNNGSAAVQDGFDHASGPKNLDRNETKKGFDPPAEAGTEMVRRKVTYKDALEKGTKETQQKKEGSIEKEIQTEKKGETKREIVSSGSSDQESGRKGSNEIRKQITEEETKGAIKREESISRDDPILELFESAWLMAPRKTSEGSSLS